MGIFSKLFSSKKQDGVNEPEEEIEVTKNNASEAIIDYCEEGYKQLAARSFVLAMEYFQAAIETKRNDGNAYIGLSEAYLAQGKTGEAEKVIYQYLATNPDSKNALEQLDKIKGRKNEQVRVAETQAQGKNSEEELKEKIRSSIKVTIGDDQKEKIVLDTPFDPHFDLMNFHLPTLDSFHDTRSECDSLRCLLDSEKFKNSNDALPCAIGTTEGNEACVIDLVKMPNLLIAGSTGTGKSTLCHSMIFSLLMKKHPADLKLVMIDLKGLEFNYYNRIVRHYLAKMPSANDDIVTDADNAICTLKSLGIEIDQRVELLKSANCRNVEEYNETFKARKLLPTEGHPYLPYIVLVIDDYSLLISSKGKEASEKLLKLLGMGKAVGIHSIIGTSRVSSDVFSNQMKSCIPARIVFRVNSASESRSLLDMVGANTLGEYGEMMFLIPGNSVTKFNCAAVSSDDIKGFTEFIGCQIGYPESYFLPDVRDPDDRWDDYLDNGERDSLFEEAARIVVQTQQGSTTMIQRKLKIGYNRSGRIIDQLEAAGIVGPFMGSHYREVKVANEFALEQILRDLDD